MQDTQSGCYSVCTNCNINGNCCSSLDKINTTVLNKKTNTTKKSIKKR